MRVSMRVATALILGGTLSLSLFAQEGAPKPTVTEQSLPGNKTPETPEKGNPVVQSVLTRSTESGYLEPAKVQALMEQVRFADFRINDLLTDVHPERRTIAATARASFEQTLSTLREQMKSLEEWRSLLAQRPDSTFLAYQTYAAINAVLPRLDGVGTTIAQTDNPSFGAQLSQAGDRLFDLQQQLGGYISFLLQNQDRVQWALESNLSTCQSQLGQAMRGETQRAKPIPNQRPVRARRTTRHKPS